MSALSEAIAAERLGWSPEEEAALQRRHRDGATVEQLAKTHFRTEIAICARLKKLGLYDHVRDAPKKWTNKETMALQRLHHDGVTIEQMSKVHGRSKEAIVSKLRKLGLHEKASKTSRKWTPEEEAELRCLHKQGATIKQLAETYEQTENQIINRLRKLGNIQDPPQDSAPRMGHPWSPEEDDFLRSKYQEGVSVGELTEMHERGERGILFRLLGLGFDVSSLIEASYQYQRSPLGKAIYEAEA